MARVSLHVPAPDFALTDYTGRLFRLSEQRGRNVVLIFNRGFV